MCINVYIQTTNLTLFIEYLYFYRIHRYIVYLLLANDG